MEKVLVCVGFDNNKAGDSDFAERSVSFGW